MEKFPDIIRDSSVVTISGSIPKGVKADIYGRLISIAKTMGKQVILDSSGETLREGIRCCPTIVKPNQDEIQQFFHERSLLLKSPCPTGHMVYSQ